MQPKFIILKIQSKTFYKLLVRELTNYNRIKFFGRKINGTYTVVLKCQGFYDAILDTSISNIYLSYIYLYTSISLILSDLIIKYYEQKITRQILYSKYSYLSPYEMSKISNITHAVLDSNYPSIDSKKLYLYRKDLILTKLLSNFRNQNYIYTDFFAYFKLNDYHEHLENVIQKTCSYY